MGALVAAALAGRHANSFAGLVTIDITPSSHPSPAHSEPVRDFINDPSSFASYEEVVDRAIATGIGRDRATLERGVILNTRRREDGRLSSDTTSPLPRDGPAARPALEDVTRLCSAMAHVPGDRQLLVTGTRGIVERDKVVEFLRRTPGARHEELVAGHNVERDAPDALARVLREHLDGHREPDRRDAPPGGSRTGRWALSSK